MAGTLFGVDVSMYQGKINWGLVKKSGLTFAVARCVREGGGIDPNYARNVDHQRKAGLIPGAYAFLAGGGVAKSQARSFIKAVGNPKGMLVMLDVERPSAHPVPSLGDVRTFVAEWKKVHPEHPLLIYGSSGSVLGSMASHADLHALGPLWLAFYRQGSGTTAKAFYDSIGANHANQWRLKMGGWAGPSIWQFTSKRVHVPGIANSKGKPRRVDTNAFRGTREQLLALTGGGAVPIATSAAKPKPGHPSVKPATHAAPAKPAAGKVFHTVKPGETLSGIAAKFGFKGFRALINLFPENHKFKANPGLIHVGDRVRVN